MKHFSLFTSGEKAKPFLSNYAVYKHNTTVSFYWIKKMLELHTFREVEYCTSQKIHITSILQRQLSKIRLIGKVEAEMSFIDFVRLGDKKGI